MGRYDVARLLGGHGLVNRAQPSNPKAFLKPPVRTPARASQVVSASSLARAIGLSAGDREYLARSLTGAARGIDGPKVTAATLARRAFGGPQFRDVLGGGELPDREEFKLVFPTIRHLESLLPYANAEEALAAARKRVVQPVEPKVIGEGEDRWIELPDGI